MASRYQKLLNKHVLVIGGTAGIGFAVAEGSLAAGARVSVSSSSQARVDAAVAKLRASFPDGGAVAGFACDLSKPTVERDIEALFAQVGRLDHIVFTAGDRLATAPLAAMTYEALVAAGQVRFFAALLVAKVGSGYLSPGPFASITLTSGSVSQRPYPGWSMVTGYAAGLHGVTRSLALDLKPVRVNLVCPGAVKTELLESVRGGDGAGAGEGADVPEAVLTSVPTGRLALPEDIAEAYLFLMKDASVTGTVVDSNSGALLV